MATKCSDTGGGTVCHNTHSAVTSRSQGSTVGGGSLTKMDQGLGAQGSYQSAHHEVYHSPSHVLPDTGWQGRAESTNGHTNCSQAEGPRLGVPLQFPCRTLHRASQPLLACILPIVCPGAASSCKLYPSVSPYKTHCFGDAGTQCFSHYSSVLVKVALILPDPSLAA